MTYTFLHSINNLVAVFKHQKGPHTMDSSIPCTPLAGTLSPGTQQFFVQLLERQTAFMTFITAEQQISDDAVWQAIQAHGGMRGMCADGASLMAFLRSLGVSKDDPEEFALASSRARVLYLSWFLVIIDRLLQWLEPRIGRPIARIAAREYFDLCLQGQTLVEVHRPDVAQSLAL